MEKLFKELFFLASQGVSLSIADAKVDTFYVLTKQYKNFFKRKFKQFSQVADFQYRVILEHFEQLPQFDISALQCIEFLLLLILKATNTFFGQNPANLSKKSFILSFFSLLVGYFGIFT